MIDHLTQKETSFVCDYDTCRPADFSSFCVVDFADDRQHELVSGVLNQSAKHGLENGYYKNEYRHVTEAVTVHAGALHRANMAQQVCDCSILLCRASSCSSSHT
jgi:hypothetical protein